MQTFVEVPSKWHFDKLGKREDGFMHEQLIIKIILSFLFHPIDHSFTWLCSSLLTACARSPLPNSLSSTTSIIPSQDGICRTIHTDGEGYFQHLIGDWKKVQTLPEVPLLCSSAFNEKSSMGYTYFHVKKRKKASHLHVKNRRLKVIQA